MRIPRSLLPMLFAASAGLLLGGSPVGAQAGRQPAVAAVFRGDTRLDQKVSLTQKNVPLGEVLPPLGRTLHVPLTANVDAADDKVSLFLKERPAAEVLSLVAR